jgi:ubiquinone/menaquinone biosynthesis C-methylase UbiE
MDYWDKIYQTKKEDEVSWFQSEPVKSLELIDEFKLPRQAKIIDIGGGESRLVDHLLKRGFKNISVLDISSIPLEKMKGRLGEEGNNVEYITSDVTKFVPHHRYDLWHDRATFHFLTSMDDIEKYLAIASNAIADGGYLIISTFSKTGPDKCSGLEISKYSEDELKKVFGKYFENIKCFNDTHVTPWGSKQDFVFCGFRKSNRNQIRG